jgi:hypothetical protein
VRKGDWLLSELRNTKILGILRKMEDLRISGGARKFIWSPTLSVVTFKADFRIMVLSPLTKTGSKTAGHWTQPEQRLAFPDTGESYT